MSITTVKPSLTIKRRLRALPAQVYSAWTEPEKVKRWFGPGGAQVTLAEFDARTGGRYRIVAKSPDGNEHDVRGVFREVIPDEKLVYTWAWHSMPERKSLVTVEFKHEGTGTLLNSYASGFLRRARTRSSQRRLERRARQAREILRLRPCALEIESWSNLEGEFRWPGRTENFIGTNW